MADIALRTTPLHALHKELGARMVPFAGYDMPVQFPLGVLGEHRHTREAAGLFDVSHMGQVRLTAATHTAVAAALETLVPGDITGLGEGSMRYSLLLNDDGGMLDDLMITRPRGQDGVLLVVVNAACKEGDLAHMRARLAGKADVTPLEDRALLALQGPAAGAVFTRLCPEAAALTFLTGAAFDLDGVDLFVTRSGYTGEDGFEISVPAAAAEALARRLLAEPEVAPIGLGARDSLRLEAGLCLYGQDIDTTTTPVEASLLWTIAKARRETGGFPGADKIRAQIASGVTRKRVGIVLDDKAPARAGTDIVDDTGAVIGTVTSGTLGPSAGHPVAMGYVPPSHAKAGTALGLMVRGTARAGQVAPMPFVPHRYHRG